MVEPITQNRKQNIIFAGTDNNIYILFFSLKLYIFLKSVICVTENRKYTVLTAIILFQ